MAETKSRRRWLKISLLILFFYAVFNIVGIILLSPFPIIISMIKLSETSEKMLTIAIIMLVLIFDVVITIKLAAAQNRFFEKKTLKINYIALFVLLVISAFLFPSPFGSTLIQEDYAEKFYKITDDNVLKYSYREYQSD